MSTPVATIADALIAFIMSLLRDPAAVQEFTATPQAVMAKSGVGDACLADVKAVKPVIVDHPSVVPSPPPAAVIPVTPVHPNPPPEPPDEVIREITRIVNQFTTIDNRSTLVDQSVNQNIWTNGGDVTQIFDQDSVVASGDHAVAAGDDATVVNSDTDIRVGDVSIGNTSNDGSFNASGEDSAVVVPGTPVTPVAPGEPTDSSDLGAGVSDAVDGSLDAVDHVADAAADATAPAADTAGDAGSAGQDVAADAPAPAEVATSSAAALPVEDPLGDGLNEPQAYSGEDHSAVTVDDAYVEDQPVDDQ